MKPEHENLRLKRLREWAALKKSANMTPCKICGSMFYVPPCAKAYKKYCSRKCKYSDKDLLEKIRLKHIGMKRTKECIEKMRQRMIEGYKSGARVHPSKTDPLWSEKVRLAKAKNPWKPTLEQRLNHSKKLSGRKSEPKHILDRTAPMRGRPQTAELTKKGLTHSRVKSFSLRDATGKVYHFRNMRMFVEAHAHLFLEEDLIRKSYKKKTKTGIDTGNLMQSPCNAVKRLCLVANGTSGSWKGWTAYSLLEEVVNNGEDLLDRKMGNPIIEKQKK